MLFDQPKIVENSEIVNSTIAHGTTNPANPNAGELFYREDLQQFRVYNGVDWIIQSTADDLNAHIANQVLHITSAQNTFLDAINLPTILGSDINSIPANVTRLTTAENTLAAHIASTSVHITAAQNTFLDGLDLPTLSSTEANYLKGVTSPIQTQINSASGNFTSHINDNTCHLVANEDTFLGNLNFTTRTPVQLATDINGLSAHYLDDTRHITASQNTYLDGITIGFADTNRLAGIDSFLSSGSLGTTIASALAALNNAKVNRSGDTMTGTLTMASGARITGLPTPVAGTDAVNKDYVDIFVQGIHWTSGVTAATTQNITLSGTQTIDNIALVANSRVLVKDQSTAAENGIYIVSASSWSRAADYNSVEEMNQSATFVNSGGAVNGKASFIQTNTITNIGTNPLAFTAFSGPVINSAGNGINLQPNGGVSVNQGAGLTFVGSALAIDLYVGGGLMTTLNNTSSNSDDTAQIALTEVGTAGTYRSVTTDSKGRVVSGSNPTTIAGYGITDAVNKGGDTVTGNLNGAAFRATQGVPNNADSSTNGYAFGADGDTGMFGPGVGAVAGIVSLYTNGIERIKVTGAGAITLDTVSVTGNNITGNLIGNATSATLVNATVPVGSASNLLYGTMAGNDFFRLQIGGGSGVDYGSGPSGGGYAEIATADDGNEPIYVRQYTGVFSAIARTATLLDGVGNTAFPGSVTASTFIGGLSGNSATSTLASKASTLAAGGGNGTAMTFNWSGQGGQPTWLWGGNDGVNMYVYNPSNFSVNYANTAGNVNSISSAVGGSYTWTGIQSFRSNNNTATGAQSPLTAYSDNGSGAVMSFLRNGLAAINLGLDSDNVFRLGGWTFGANRLQIDSAGNLTMAGDVTAYSDRRMKSDITPISGALSKIAALTGVTFTRNDDGARGTGLIAQDVQAVLPEAVQEHSDGMLSVAYGNMVGLLVQAIKELQTELAEVKAALNTK